MSEAIDLERFCRGCGCEIVNYPGRTFDQCGNCGCSAVRTLTPGEEASLEKIAGLRAELGALRRERASLRTALHDIQRILLRHEHATPKPEYPQEVLGIIREALK